VYVLEAIYEEDFLGFSYGFRPGRGQHDALDALHAGIYRRQVNWVVDSDIQGFFDAMAHSWTIRFLEHRIADKRILRLIAKWLKVGITEDGRVTRSERGTPQGAVISPILANVYLHYVYDLWTHRWRRKATGDVIVIRYADDTIVGFQHEHEAKAFLHDLQERMRKFELALHPTKTRLIRFGRHAAKQREERGEGKPETFDFLGFTHFCTRSRKWGSFVIGRKTIKKRILKQLQAIKMELRKRMHDPIAKTGAWLNQMLKGYLNYYAVSGNSPSLWWYFNEVRWRWIKSLKRRSQRAFMSWEKFTSTTDAATARWEHYKLRLDGGVRRQRLVGTARPDGAPYQAGSYDVQSGHGTLCEVVLPAVIRGRSSVARYRADRGAGAQRCRYRNGHDLART
jgi:group II intron reverse transcriptase/maturase